MATIINIPSAFGFMARGLSNDPLELDICYFL
jgi:hypothetical protein